MDAAQRNLMVVLLQERPTIADVRQLFLEIVRCVQHLHGVGLIHGDLKPLNIVRDPSVPR